MKVPFRLGLVFGCLFIGVHLTFAQTWTQTSAPNMNWSSIASSADGTKLVAVTFSGQGGIWVSTNSGGTWAQTSAPQLDWIYIASSADGSRLAAVDSYDGMICSSADSGTSWITNNLPSLGWHSVALSADGTKWVASDNGYVYTSADSGTTWISNSVSSGNTAIFVASSADGTKLVAAFNSGNIFTSTNSGATWQPATFSPGTGLYSVACSASGSTLVAGAEGYILVSTNSGVTWNSNNVPVPALGPVTWQYCASSADGNILAAMGISDIVGWRNVGLIYISTNSGATWTESDAPVKGWTGVASSADGCQLVGSAFNDVFSPFPSAQFGGIYTVQTTPAPCMNITPTNGSLKLSWMVPSTSFVMQQNTDLTTTNWTVVTNPPVLNLTNLQDEVVLSPTNSSGFFRLKTP